MNNLENTTKFTFYFYTLFTAIYTASTIGQFYR